MGPRLRAGDRRATLARRGNSRGARRGRVVCGDDGAAKELSLALAAKVVGRALDAAAGERTHLEGLTAVIVNLNRRYRAHAGITVTGISRT
jgi:predicted dinucleotide-binding enzyme